MGVIYDAYGRGIDSSNPLQVTVAGASGAGGALPVTTNDILPIDKQAQLKTQIENNTTALGVSATYTGASFDTMADGTNFNLLTGYCVADQSGNLYMQESVDGTNWVTTKTWALTASNGVIIDEKIRLRYVRFMLINGATAQTSLKLYGFLTFL